MVATFGNGERLAGGFTHPGLHAECEVRYLDTGVVVVELAGDGVPGPLEQSRDRVTQSGLTAVPDVQRPGRIGGYEFHVDRSSVTKVAPAEVRALQQNAAVDQGELILREPEVDEPRTGNLGLGN